jgi:hypothetical protein
MLELHRSIGCDFQAPALDHQTDQAETPGPFLHEYYHTYDLEYLAYEE